MWATIRLAKVRAVCRRCGKFVGEFECSHEATEDGTEHSRPSMWAQTADCEHEPKLPPPGDPGLMRALRIAARTPPHYQRAIRI